MALVIIRHRLLPLCYHVLSPRYLLLSAVYRLLPAAFLCYRLYHAIFVELKIQACVQMVG